MNKIIPRSWRLTSVTCDISGGGALPLLTAGRQFSGGRIKVAQLAGESSGAAKAASFRPGHIVDGVHGGKHWRIPGKHHRLATAGVPDILRRTRGCKGEDTGGHGTRSRVRFAIVGTTNGHANTLLWWFLQQLFLFLGTVAKPFSFESINHIIFPNKSLSNKNHYQETVYKTVVVLHLYDDGCYEYRKYSKW